MSDDNEKVSSRSAVILAVVAVAVAAYAIAFGLQTLVWGKTKYWAVNNPWILDVPKPLSAPATASAAAPDAGSAMVASHGAEPKVEPIHAYGFQFTPPWKSGMKEQPSQTATAFRFDSGQVIVMFDPSTQVDVLRQMETTNSAQYLAIVSIFGPKPFESNFGLYKAVYGASPAQASPFQDRGESMRLDQLLLMKLSFGVEAPGDIFEFTFGSNQGLQFGDPAKSLPVAAHMFNDREDQFRLVFTVAAGSDGKITQEDINEVLASLGHISYVSH